MSSWDTWTGPERKANKEGYDYVHNYMLVEIGGKKLTCAFTLPVAGGVERLNQTVEKKLAACGSPTRTRQRGSVGNSRLGRAQSEKENEADIPHSHYDARRIACGGVARREKHEEENVGGDTTEPTQSGRAGFTPKRSPRLAGLANAGSARGGPPPPQAALREENEDDEAVLMLSHARARARRAVKNACSQRDRAVKTTRRLEKLIGEMESRRDTLSPTFLDARRPNAAAGAGEMKEIARLVELVDAASDAALQIDESSQAQAAKEASLKAQDYVNQMAILSVKLWKRADNLQEALGHISGSVQGEARAAEEPSGAAAEASGAAEETSGAAEEPSGAAEEPSGAGADEEEAHRAGGEADTPDSEEMIDLLELRAASAWVDTLLKKGEPPGWHGHFDSVVRYSLRCHHGVAGAQPSVRRKRVRGVVYADLIISYRRGAGSAEVLTAREWRAREDCSAAIPVLDKHKRTRIEALYYQKKQARGMKERAAKTSEKAAGPMTVGSVVQVRVSDVDRGRLDHPNATVVVVDAIMTPSGHERFRLATQAGVLGTTYTIADLKHLSLATPRLHQLHSVLETKRGLPTIGLRATMRAASTSGTG
ncbi:MAG: hypothetical protein SGPRY_001943 [Prymnesium sp.]